MPRKRKLSNVRERCRICLVQHGCMSSLFDESLNSKIKDLTKCTSIDINDEQNMPNIICHVCLYKLDMWTEFKKQFIQSNRMLLGQLELSELSDNTVSQSNKMHKDTHHSPEESLSDNPDKRKPKTEIPPLIPLEFASVDCITDQTALKEMYISEDEPTSSKDSSQKIHDSNSNKSKNEKEDENKEEVQMKPSLVPMKVKSLSGKRGRTTERRKASTKRWVARKKALLAATGENESDTDSVGSDDTQLSPVQKARAKTNADKEAEKQKRLAKTLKNLETNMVGKYGTKHDSDSLLCPETDSDVHVTRSQKEFNSTVSQVDKNSVQNDCVNQDEIKKDKSPSHENLREKNNSASTMPDNASKEDFTKKNDIQIIEENFTPHSVKSELEVGDATYIVTSTLILAEPNFLNKANVNNLSKDYKNVNTEQSPQEKNTDIIDAVQLRRIHPVQTDSSDKKCVERCLNIEVEGTELEALKRVQVELAGFVEKEMKHRLFGTNSSSTQKEQTENTCKSSYQTLDQQLKSIVEKAIKKNFESSMMRNSCGSTKLYNENSRTVSPAFITAAMNSKKYQPKVVVKRLDVTKESKHHRINNIHVISRRAPKSKLGPFSMVARKRQSVLPIKFNDYNTSAMDSDSNLSEDMQVSEPPRTANNRNVETYRTGSTKKSQLIATEDTIDNTKHAERSLFKTIDPNSIIISTSVSKGSIMSNKQKVENDENVAKAVSSVGEKHYCGVCGQSFNSRNEVATHVRTHKVDSSVPRHNKHKMMRCKRCHEIVEARFVKAHVCKSMKQVHKCYVCNSTFRTEKLLVRHLESHDQSEFNIENITKGESKKSMNASAFQNSKHILLSKLEKDHVLKTEGTIIKADNGRTGITNGQPDKVVITKGMKLESGKAFEKPKETYTCFVCDKIFTDEEVLKDHLQKHCDDVSEGEQSTGKEQYQCAICGDSMDSEDALEAHVEKHLFDDEDDNPNLISIANENEKPKMDSYQCLQCAEVFNSEMLLEMHMQAHEEEAAIAEWEKQGIKSYEFQCMICDELFETEEELSEHLDVHNGNAHVCQLCEKPFPSLEDLQQHVATH